MRRKKIYLRTSALLVLIMLSTGTFAKDYILHSPDHRVSVTIGISDSIGFNVIMDGKSIVKAGEDCFLTDMSADKKIKGKKGKPFICKYCPTSGGIPKGFNDS